MRLVPFFIPDELLVLVLMGAGLAWIIGARRVALSLVGLVAMGVVLPPILEPMIQAMPVWVLWIGLAYLLFLIPFIGVVIFQALVSPVLGRRTAQEMGGHLAADVARATIVIPFRVLGAIFRFLGRLWGR